MKIFCFIYMWYIKMKKFCWIVGRCIICFFIDIIIRDICIDWFMEKLIVLKVLGIFVMFNDYVFKDV